jgi:hypothetical protein
MAYLGGPPGRRRNQLRLHDLPPGYTPPRPRPQDARRQLRQDQILLRIAIAAGVLLVGALVVVSLVVIATRL